MEDLVRGAKVVESARCELLGDSGSAAISEYPRYAFMGWSTRAVSTPVPPSSPFTKPDAGRNGIWRCVDSSLLIFPARSRWPRQHTLLDRDQTHYSTAPVIYAAPPAKTRSSDTTLRAYVNPFAKITCVMGTTADKPSAMNVRVLCHLCAR